MKKLFLLYSITIFTITINPFSQSYAQSVSINNDGSAPNLSAILDVKSTTSGMLVPRMTSAQRTAIASPANGLIVYQTDAANGFWYFDGTTWKQVSAQLPGGINFRYYAGTNQTINAYTDTKINFGNQSFLNNATFSGSTFTAPSSGLYNLSVSIFTFGSTSPGNFTIYFVVNNIVKTSRLFNISSGTYGFSDNIILATGDQVNVHIDNSSATIGLPMSPCCPDANNYFTAFKIN